MTNLAIFAAVSIALGATPTVAQVNAGQQKPEKPAAAADQKKYCMTYDDTTGSRIAKEVCLTRKQWADRGVDLDEYLKK